MGYTTGNAVGPAGPAIRWGRGFMKLLVLDGNSIINRAFYGIKLLSTKDGLYTNALFGFLNILTKLLDEGKPDALCVTFDRKAPTFRHLAYEGYKATRKGMPDELASQLPLLKDVLAAMNIPMYELDGWEAESQADQLLNGLGIPMEQHTVQMNTLSERQKVKVLLAKALFGSPSIILLDEPTNGLDIDSIEWLEEFLIDYDGTILVVSHDRHFLNAVCTHIVDIDYNKVQMYAGNYDFWYESSQLMQQLIRNQNKKKEEKIRDLQNFIQRFSANKSKSKQATSRKKILDSITLEEMPASSRKYPYVGFEPEREAGKDILFVEGITKTLDGVKVLDNVSFIANKGDKIALVGENEAGQTALFKILTGEMEPDAGSFKWGVSTSQSYFPQDNSAFFEGFDEDLICWLRQYSEDTTETYLRGFLGRMLFSGDEVYKPAKVLSGGEKVRCMLSRMMMTHANVLLLDQPTNHLDLESIQALADGLARFPGNLLFSSHDHQFIDEIANRIIELPLGEPGCLDRTGTYEEFLEWKHNR